MDSSISVPHSPSQVKSQLSQNGSLSSTPSSTSLDNDNCEDNNDQQIIESLTSQYGGGIDLLNKTLEHLKENIKAGICLICIEDVGRQEAVWSCDMCYCILHLVCIQRWARDSVENIKEKIRDKGFSQPLIYCCPKCRNEYDEIQFPDKYKCFCGKVTNPLPDPWNAPHSCANQCGKLLKPECGHKCVLLCHSGPCPPCPKQITNTCYCGQSSPRTLRCYAKTWSCLKVCSKILPCGFHKCPNTCHPGVCAECQVKTKLKCKCASPKELTVECWKLMSPDFHLSCDSECGRLLDCGVHKCPKICHEEKCGSCERTCPCGKARVPCTGDVETEVGKPCENICDKVLDCGNHYCSQKCHVGSCGPCLEEVKKVCKCGQYEKDVLCSKEFTCATKCKRLRDCKIHACNRKCCPGECPPCQNICGRTLSCRNHKCQSICHCGPCFPCPVTAQVKCRCGMTVRQVPCGSEKKFKHPDCHEPCTRSPKCDHSQIQNHRCHFGDCPKCKLPCGKTLVCGHKCPAVCHTLKKGEGCKPCPPCIQNVNSKCPLHSNVQVQCNVKDERCIEICGKPLPCNEHFHEGLCHECVSSSCGSCTEPCGKPRPLHCTHQCDQGCHQGPCPPCTLVAKIPCHCNNSDILVQCFKQSKLSEQDKSCKNQCPKKLPCGHRCLILCHLGDCQIEKCKRKIRLTCKCKHVKKDLECFLVGETKVLECQQGICFIPKILKETPTSGVRKRTRKKKVSETKGEDEVEDNFENNERLDNHDKRPPSFFSSNLKAIGITLLSALITATILKFYGSFIIPDGKKP